MDLLPTDNRHRTYGGNAAFHNFANDYSHIQDPNLRRRLALSEIDKVPFGLYHIRAVLVAGVGFFLDSYDIFAINLITVFLGLSFWEGSPEDARNGFGGNYGTLPTSVNQALKASTSGGIIIGQLFFGWLADVIGRRRMYGIELIIIVVATLLCALANPSQSVNSAAVLIFWRVIMGVGIGGDYPLSAVITSEFSSTRWRGAMMAGVFSMQGIGQLLAAVVAFIVTIAFKGSFQGISGSSTCDYDCQLAADRCWRIIVGVGATPACFALYYRITIPETPRYTFDVAHDVEKADADIKAYMASKSKGEVDTVRQARLKKVAGPSLSIPDASRYDFVAYFKEWKNLRTLLGTTLSWFFLDLAYYGLSLNNTLVLDATGVSSGASLYHQLRNNAVGMIILSVAGSLPGYWTAILIVDTFGRRSLQIIGFVLLAIIFAIIGFAYNHLSSQALLALYVIAQYLFDAGPNTTTFLIPGECFPTRYRASGHGVSAAAGKIGAIIAQIISIPLLTRPQPVGCTGTRCSPWLGNLMRLFALFMLCGAIVSLLVPETKGLTLEELAGEAPTSYNAGRNGSICVPGSQYKRDGSAGAMIRRLNPFIGGKPAGFAYPRIGSIRGAWRATGRSILSTSNNRSSADINIETGKKMPSSGSGGRKKMRKRKQRYGMPGTDTDKQYGMSSSTSSTRPMNDDDITDPRRPGSASEVPAWNAGWGRIDRGATTNNIPLQDIGGLI